MATVLVVEDDALLSKLYTTLLTNHGHKVVVANDGVAGLKMATEEKPNLIMLDIMMPKMNGLQVLDELKKNVATSNIPVVVLTGLSKVNEEKDVLARGASKYLDKAAYDPKVVAEMIDQLVKVDPDGAPTVTPVAPAQPKAEV